MYTFVFVLLATAQIHPSGGPKLQMECGGTFFC
jgi:hypothetical protein